MKAEQRGKEGGWSTLVGLAQLFELSSAFWTELRTYSFSSRALWDSHQTPAVAQQFAQQLPQPWPAALRSSGPPFSKTLQRGKKRHQKRDHNLLLLPRKGQGMQEALEGTAKTQHNRKNRDFGAFLKHVSGFVTQGMNCRSPCNRACEGPIKQMFKQTGRSPSRTIKHRVTD